MQKQRLGVLFFRTLEGREPVRDWLKGLPNDERKAIGDDLRTLQFGWPVGMPLLRKLDSDLWELRIDLPNRIARCCLRPFKMKPYCSTVLLRRLKRHHSPI